MTHTLSQFFTNTVPAKPEFINVGGIGDCGFLTCASGVIDNAFKIRPNQALLRKVLERHNKHYPLPFFQNMQTPSGYVKDLINSIKNKPESMNKFMHEFADTIRQMTVDELCANPLSYPGAFVGKNEGTSPQEMRKQTTWIDESYIAAASHALQIPIKVKVVADGKEIPARLHYGQEYASHDKIVMQLQNNHYIPQIANPVLLEAFKKQALQPAHPLEPKVESQKADPELSELLKLIEAENTHLLKVFKDSVERLQKRVQLGELSKDNLLTIYIKGMNNSDYLQGRVKYVGIEHGNQNFFNAIENTKRRQAIGGLPNGSHDEQVTKELIHAIARAISIGQLNADDVFEYEQPANTGSLFKK